MSSSAKSHRKADVVILTAIPLEYQAVLQVEAGAREGSQWEEEKGPNGLPVAFRAFQSKGGRPLRVAVALAGNMGAVAATNALLPLVADLRPRCVAMCGVCAGRPGETNLGDVIAAEHLFFHDTGKRRPGEVLKDLTMYNLREYWATALKRFDFATRFRTQEWWTKRPIPYEWQENWVLAKLREGVTQPASHPEREERCPQWATVIQSLWKSGRVSDGKLSLTRKGRDSIERLLNQHGGRLPDLSPSGKKLPFTVHVASIASGSQVIEDENIWNELSASVPKRKTLGLEMEGAALGALVHAQRDLKLDAPLVMKGVMDFANAGRDDHFKEFAARASAECLLAFLREYVPVEVVPGLDDLLSPGTEPLPENPPPSALLNARYEIVPFDERGREDILEDLERWCDAGPPVAVRLIHAEGGVGKTRLALEWARRRGARGWAAGFLEKSVPEDWFERLWAGGQPALVVIDYAESRADLRAMLQRVQRYSRQEGAGPLRRMRLLLLARNAGDWWESLRQSDGLDTLLGATRPWELLPLAMEHSERERVFLQAAERFARHRGRTHGKPASIPLSDGRFVRVLYLHMAALAWVEGLSFEANTLMDVVLDHEERFWDTRLQQSDWALAAQRWLARQVLVAATLRGGFADASTASQVVQRLLGQALDPREKELLRLLHRIYQRTGSKPSGGESSVYLPALEPDLLGEGMVARAASPRTEEDRLPPDWIDRVLPSQEEARVLGLALEVLGRASAARPDAVRPWLERLLAGPLLRSRASLALEAAKAVGLRTASSVLGDVLAERLQVDGDAALAQQLDDEGIPFPTVSLGRVAEWTSRTLLKAPSSPELERTTDRRARLLANQGLQLSARGAYREAVKLLGQSVDLYRPLAKQHPLLNAPLAGSLDSLGLALRMLGRHGEALRAHREVVELRRGLVKLAPHIFQLDLAMGLNDLGLVQRELERHAQAVESLREAISLFRPLAEHGDMQARRFLAGSLDNLGNSLSALKQHAEALAVSSEAVAAFRVLAQLDADTVGSQLAAGLDNLATRLSNLGRHEEALERTRESVGLYRSLAKLNPGAFGPELAASLENLGLHLASLGRKDEALEAGREALGLLRDLAQDDPEALQPALAKCLGNQGGRWVALERYEEGVDAAREAAALYRPLMKHHPDVYRPTYAATLFNLRAGLHGLGRAEEERAVLREMVPLYQRLAKSDPETYRATLAHLLDLQGESAREANQPEALADSRAAVALYRVLAKEDPDRFQPKLASRLLTLGFVLKARGHKKEALEVASEAAALHRPLVERDLDTFWMDAGNGLALLSELARDLGRHDEALSAARELIALERRVEPHDPGRAERALASHLHMLGNRLGRVGQCEEALKVTLESVSRLRVLVPRDPEALNFHYADSLRHLGHRWLEQGRSQDAVDAAQEALGLYRASSSSSPEELRPRLADNLWLLSRALGRQRRWADALEASREAVRLYFILAEGSPEQYQGDFISLLTEMRNHLTSLGAREEALQVSREQVQLCRVLIQRGVRTLSRELPAMLIALSHCLSELGLYQEARARGEEALELLWPSFERNRLVLAKDLAQLFGRLERIYAATRRPMPHAVQRRRATFQRYMRP